MEEQVLNAGPYHGQAPATIEDLKASCCLTKTHVAAAVYAAVSSQVHQATSGIVNKSQDVGLLDNNKMTHS